MRKLSVLILTAFMVMNTAISSAEQKSGASQKSSSDKSAPKPPSPAAGEQDKSVQTLMATLNETLEENRKIREVMVTLQSAIEQASAENNFLKGELQKAKDTIEQADLQGQAQIGDLKKQLQSSSDKVAELQNDNERYVREKTEAEGKLEEAQEENVKLKDLLGSSILESEKVEYLNMIVNAKEAANSAVDQLAQKNVENQKLKSEVAALHYSLGNILFEFRDYKNAADQYQKTLQWDPANSWAHHNLAVIYDYYMNDNPSAIFHYEKYLNLKPVEEKAHEVRQRILDLKMLPKVTPEIPLRNDFEKLHKKPQNA